MFGCGPVGQFAILSAKLLGADRVIAVDGIADRLEITEVAASPDGDVRFPEIDKGRWREVSREGPVQGEKDTAAVSFVTYERLTY